MFLIIILILLTWKQDFNLSRLNIFIGHHLQILKNCFEKYFPSEKTTVKEMCG